MKEYKSVIITCIAGICAIICVLIGTGGLKEAKLGRTGEGLSATGSASVDFESDLAVFLSAAILPERLIGRLKKTLTL